MADNNYDLGGYQVAQNQLLQIQQQQQQNIVEAQQASRASGDVNQAARQAAGLLTANQTAAINANVNPQTRGILQKYGVGKPQTVRSQNQRTVGQNVVINNNTTTNNYGGPVQGRELSFKGNDIAMKKQAEETNRFKAWLSGLFNKQDAEDARRDREFVKRGRALEKQSERVTKKLGELGKNVVEGLSPKRVVKSMNSGLRRLLMIFGFHLLAKNWDKILNKVADIENTVKGWINYFKTGGGVGKKVNGFIQDLRVLFMGKDAANSNKSLFDYLKDIFVGDEKNSIWSYIKLYFKDKGEERSQALSRLSFPEITIDDFDNIPGLIMKVFTYLGDVISVSVNGLSGLKKSAHSNIMRTARKRTYKYNDHKNSLYNNSSARQYGAYGSFKIMNNTTGKVEQHSSSEVAAGDLAVLSGDYQGLYKGNINRFTGKIKNTPSARLGQAAELSSLITAAKNGYVHTSAVSNAFQQLYDSACEKDSQGLRARMPLPEYLLNHLKHKEEFISKAGVKKEQWRVIYRPRASADLIDAIEESPEGAAALAYGSNEALDKLGVNKFIRGFARTYGRGQNIANESEEFDRESRESANQGLGITGDALSNILTTGTLGFINAGENSFVRGSAQYLNKNDTKKFISVLVPKDYKLQEGEVESSLPLQEVYTTDSEGIRELAKELIGSDAINYTDQAMFDRTRDALNQMAFTNGATNIVHDEDDGIYDSINELEKRFRERDKNREAAWNNTRGHEMFDRVGEKAEAVYNNTKNKVGDFVSNAGNYVAGMDINLSNPLSNLGNNNSSTSAPIVATSYEKTTVPDNQKVSNNNSTDATTTVSNTTSLSDDTLNLDAATEYCRRPKKPIKTYVDDKGKVHTDPSSLDGPDGALFVKSAEVCLHGVWQILKHGGLYKNHSDASGVLAAYLFDEKIKRLGWKLVTNVTNVFDEAIPGDIIIIHKIANHYNGHIQFLAGDGYWYSDFWQRWYRQCLNYKDGTKIPESEVNKVSCLYRYPKIYKSGKLYKTIDEEASSDGNIDGEDDNSLSGRVKKGAKEAGKFTFDALLNSGLFEITGSHQIKDGEEITGELTSYELYKKTPNSELKYLRSGMNRADWAREVRNQTGKNPGELIAGTVFNSRERLFATFTKRRETNGYYNYSPINRDIFNNPSSETTQAIKEASDQSTTVFAAGQESQVELLASMDSKLSELNHSIIAFTADKGNSGTPAPDLSRSDSAIPAEALQ